MCFKMKSIIVTSRSLLKNKAVRLIASPVQREMCQLWKKSIVQGMPLRLYLKSVPLYWIDLTQPTLSFLFFFFFFFWGWILLRGFLSPFLIMYLKRNPLWNLSSLLFLFSVLLPSRSGKNKVLGLERPESKFQHCD